LSIAGCDTKADVTFMIDSSNNVGTQNFQKQLNFIKDVSNNMQVAPDKVQVSALTFGTGVTNQFYLNQYTDNNQLQQAIMNIPYKGGQAKMANAIRFATGTSFSPIHGGRADAPHVAVLLTNQPSGTIDQIKLESQTARDNGLILYTVGVGNKVDQSELQTIASDPDSRHMFSSQNFDALGSLSDLLATKICNGMIFIIIALR
jgi:collagen type VI alpha